MIHAKRLIANRQLFSLLTGLLLVFVGLGLSPMEAKAQAQQKAKTGVQTPDVVVDVKGMACSSCAYNMKKQMQKNQAVDSVEVLLDEQKVLLTLKKGQTITEAKLEESVTKAGFSFRKAKFMERKYNKEAKSAGK